MNVFLCPCMHIHYFTLKRLSAWLQTEFTGAMCMECISQDKDELVLGLATTTQQIYLRVNCGNPFPYIWPITSFNRAKKNVAEIFPEIREKIISKFEVLPWERVMFIVFEDGSRLILKMHGGRSNVILESGKTRTLFRNNIPEDETLEFKAGEYHPAELDHYMGDVAPTLKKISSVFDKHFVNFIERKTDEGIGFRTAFDQAIHEAETGNFYLVIADKGPVFSLLRQTEKAISLPALISSALDIFLRTKFRFSQYLQQYSAIEKQVTTEWKVATKQLKAYSDNLDILKKDRSPEEIANILMANLHAVPSHVKEVELFDFYQDKPLKIIINPEWSPQENAAHYFRKSKKRKTQVHHLEELKKDAEQKKENWQARMDAFLQMVPPKEINFSEGVMDTTVFTALNRYVTQFPEFSAEKVKAAEKASEFWEFFCQGYRILVGKNSKNNDKLSFQIAKKDDVWLHAKDVAGSHVVIQNPSGKDVPSTVLEFAAKLAAKNSKRKSESLVPVSWTFKKYVRKPKGFAAGAVMVDRETVLLIRQD